MSAELVFKNRQRAQPLNVPLLRRIVRHLLREEFTVTDYELCFHFVAEEEMAEVNWQFLQHKGSTDVITFDHAETNEGSGALHGEIFISIPDAVKQAHAFGTTWQNELTRYVIHGLLHLRGYDDLKPAARRSMKREENRLFKKMAAQFPLHDADKLRHSSFVIPKMDERSTGIILRTRPLTETSLIIHWLTADMGRIATVAKGARRPKSPFRGKLDLFFEADFSFARSRKSDLHNLREVALRDSHGKLRENLGWIQQASYAAALVEQTTETETPLPKIFQLMRDFLAGLADSAPSSRTIFAFEFKLLEELGLSPEPTESKLSEGSRQLARSLKESDWNLIARLKLSEQQTRELRQFLHGFLIYHLERVPASRTAALNAE